MIALLACLLACLAYSPARSLARLAGMTNTEMREAKKAHAQRLENRGGGASRAGLLSGQDPLMARAEGSGIGGISQDKLLELRAKRLSHKRNTIVS